jgi:hypothetical protein
MSGRGYGVGYYGDSLFGVTNYIDGAATATPGASVSANATATFVSGQPQQIDATVTATADMVRVKSVEGIVESASVIVSNAETVVAASASTSVSASATASFLRVRTTDGISTAQAVTVTIGREKWEPIAVGAQTWNTIAAGSQTWTEVA